MYCSSSDAHRVLPLQLLLQFPLLTQFPLLLLLKLQFLLNLHLVPLFLLSQELC